jgi:hypothetical protein
MNESDKNRSIESILLQGLTKPLTAKEHIVEMSTLLGWRFIFWDKGFSLFFSVLTLSGVFALFTLAPEAYRCSAAVAAAPLLFLIAILFSETAERLSGLYELKQTCRYTVQQVTALRVGCYSLLGLAFSAVIAAVSANSGPEFIALFPLCLSALFLCAILALAANHLLRSQWVHALFAAVWVFANLALPYFWGDQWEALLREMPVIFSIGLAVSGAIILACQLSNMLRGGHTYAAA